MLVYTGKYEERIGIACQSGLHIFSSSLAVVPYDTWTHIAMVCAPEPVKEKERAGIFLSLYTLSMYMCSVYVSMRVCLS